MGYMVPRSLEPPTGVYGQDWLFGFSLFVFFALEIYMIISTYIFWKHRKEYAIAVRYPVLATANSVYTMFGIGASCLNQIMLGAGKYWNCTYTVLMNHGFNVMALGIVAFRGWRLLVIYDPVKRQKWAKYTTPEFLRRTFLISISLSMIFGVFDVFFISKTYNQLQQNCQTFNFYWYWIGLDVAISAHLNWVLMELRKVDDIFGISMELSGMFMIWSGLGMVQFVLFIVWDNFYNILDMQYRHIHLDWINIFGQILITYVGIIHPVQKMKERNAILKAKFGDDWGNKVGKEKHLPSTFSQSKTERSETHGGGEWTLASIFTSESMYKLFEAFANRCLCVENVRFYKAAMDYERAAYVWRRRWHHSKRQESFAQDVSKRLTENTVAEDLKEESVADQPSLAQVRPDSTPQMGSRRYSSSAVASVSQGYSHESPVASVKRLIPSSKDAKSSKDGSRRDSIDEASAIPEEEIDDAQVRVTEPPLPEEFFNKAQEIYRTYIEENSEYEINISYHQRGEYEKQFPKTEEGARKLYYGLADNKERCSIFRAAKEEVFHLMRDNLYRQFMLDQTFRDAATLV